MTPNATTLHRKNTECNGSAEENPDADRRRLCQLAGVPDIKPYPYTAINLTRTANELLHNAVIKASYGRPNAADACRKLAAMKLREAAEITPPDTSKKPVSLRKR